MSDKIILVSIDLAGKTALVGRLFCHYHKGRDSASFEYDRTWLENSDNFALEPVLKLTPGQFQTTTNQKIFGAIGDSAPDRWGRTLMQHAETNRAREKEETPRSLSEADFLLGVNDKARLGALRFSLESQPALYLEHEDKNPIPPLISLPKLLSASEDFSDKTETAQDLRLLLAPGSSLGGARAKASVLDGEDLYIAKFPQKNDAHNVILWEIITLKLAEMAKITVSEWRHEKILGKDTLLLRRFDRDGGSRIPFLSAMSMLGAHDGEEGHSYFELADALGQCGAAPERDKEELWRRIVFTVLISNTDDHLRNHGFLYSGDGRGWRLSPAYDINPTSQSEKPRLLSTAIDFDDNRASLDLALSTAEYYGLTAGRAKEIIREVATAVRHWPCLAKQYDLKEQEIDYMRSAFEHEDGKKAHSL